MSERSSTASGGVVAAGIERVEMFGRHVGERAADKGAADLGLGRIGQRVDGQVEVEQHGRSVAGQQDIRRLQIAVEQAARMGMLEPIGQAGHDPHRGLDGRGAVQELARRLVVIAFCCSRVLAGATAAGRPSGPGASEIARHCGVCESAIEM